jgi:hypothetical protein
LMELISGMLMELSVIKRLPEPPSHRNSKMIEFCYGFGGDTEIT